MLSLFRRLSDDFRPACSTWHEASLISSKDAFRLDVVLFDESFPEVKEHLAVAMLLDETGDPVFPNASEYSSQPGTKNEIDVFFESLKASSEESQLFSAWDSVWLFLPLRR